MTKDNRRVAPRLRLKPVQAATARTALLRTFVTKKDTVVNTRHACAESKSGKRAPIVKFPLDEEFSNETESMVVIVDQDSVPG